MTISEQKHRIIFIDLMRAFAVLQMVQGHTINVLLAEQFRNTDFIFYAVWHFMRGMTAPIFMFTAGIVFTYLFRSVKKPFSPNEFSLLKEGYVLIIGNPPIGSKIGLELRRTQVNEKGSEAPGLLNWIPIYNEQK